jgi:cytochrome b involved in lipid metabolism
MATTTMEPESAAETSVPQAKTITLAECQGHMSDKDCWLVVDGKVYDVTPFLDEHPGGFDTLVSNSGDSYIRQAVNNMSTVHEHTLPPQQQ